MDAGLHSQPTTPRSRAERRAAAQRAECAATAALTILGQKWVLRIVREHWSIENGLHWPLDVVLDEDLARHRKDSAPANLAVLRRLALNIARAHPDPKMSLRAKFKRAGWDETFLFDMLLPNMR